MITPTVGRVVWFYETRPENEHCQPNAAFITYVWTERMVNLTVLGHNGETYARASVLLLQEDDATPNGFYCTWMPYQKGQAAKTEAAEAKLQLPSHMETHFAIMDRLKPGEYMVVNGNTYSKPRALLNLSANTFYDADYETKVNS